METAVGVLAASILMLVVTAPVLWAISAHQRASEAIRGAPRMATRKAKAKAKAKVVTVAPTVITAAELGVRFPEGEAEYRDLEVPTYRRRDVKGTDQ
jgi:Flp pilus assembly protein TadB